MTPKKKAKQLVCKMYGCEINTDLNNIYIINGDGYFIAKECALIAVNEIINLIGQYSIEPFVFDIDYYQEVKQEIEKL
jgi:hypothetical protein